MKEEKKQDRRGEVNPSKVERAALEIETPRSREESTTPDADLKQEKKIKSEKIIKKSVKPP